MTLSTEGKTTLGVGIVLVVLVINGFASYRATRKLIENEGCASHTHQVLGELETTLSTLKDAETGERGFIITGAEEYLEPYQAALSRIDGHVQQVKQLTADNPRQQERIPILERKIADRLEGLKTGINLRKNNDAEGARQLISSGSGKRMMDDLRKFIDGMESEENELLRQRMEESRISQR